MNEATRTGSLLSSWLVRIDGWTEACGDRINPIVVRETRQEMQGTRFATTLLLSLTVAWLASVLGTLGMYGDIEQTEIGGQMFGIFHVVLGFAVCVVVPLGLFRSMTSEFIGKTWELLVVTPMGASRIVRGKLTTAMLQAAVYMAVLTPFLCFTWLLRGIGVLQIVFGLLLLIAGSFGLCHVALFCGALVRRSNWQGVGMVMLMSACVFSWLFICTVAINAAEIHVGVWAGGGLCVGISLLYLVLVSFSIATTALKAGGKVNA